MQETIDSDSQLLTESNEVHATSSNEKTFSSLELYQMALPHIIQSNLRLQQSVANEKKRHRVKIILLVLFL